VSCLLSCGLDEEMHDGQNLADALDQIEMSDAD
jgi:hypothetical protein